MSYGGYRLIVNGVTINDIMVRKGSYKATPTKRVVAAWKDANQIEHEDIVGTRKMDISIEIRGRSADEHDTIKGVFATRENVPVTFWDDLTGDYATGTFKMDAPTFRHENTMWGDIRYASTTIHLTEY